jgi:ATP-dependent DNA helicase DinG
VPKHALDAPKSGDAEALKAYDDYCLNEMYELVKMSRGRAFLLFTSNTAVQQYYNILAPKFEAMGLKCFRQGGDIDRNQMISEFTEHGNAVLFGADTFWEGISVKGRELSLVVIHKIPFAVPNPVSKAREVNIKENGGDTFLEGQVFPAITKYKQGFGRLIRHEDDKGVFCMLDGRIFSKKDRYGIYFLRGTPKTQYAIDRDKLKPFFE